MSPSRFKERVIRSPLLMGEWYGSRRVCGVADLHHTPIMDEIKFPPSLVVKGSESDLDWFQEIEM